MDTYTTLYTAGSVPALVSTMITIIYFAVKLITYFINASTREAESRKGTLHNSIRTRPGLNERNRRPWPSLPEHTKIPLQHRRKWQWAVATDHPARIFTHVHDTYASLPLKMIQGIRQCPHYEQMLKDTKAEGVHIPGPQGPHINTTGIPPKRSKRGRCHRPRTTTL